MIEGVARRAPAVATGVKRVLPDRFVWAYQGDGDLASIGTAEIIHAAARGENISIVFINNTTYGMTGGANGPNNAYRQRSTTCPSGRDPAVNGYPIRVCEMLATLDGPSYLARVAPTSPAGIVKDKAGDQHSFENQIAARDSRSVEVLSTCPTQWRLSPIDAMKWVDTNIDPGLPAGRIRR